MKVMLDEMERHFGKRPIIYTNIEFYNAILAGGAFADYPIWVRSTKHNPAMRYSDRDWQFWQYQANGVGAGDRGRSRPQRLLRRPEAVAGVPRRAAAGRANKPPRPQRLRRSPNRRPKRLSPRRCRSAPPARQAPN